MGPLSLFVFIKYFSEPQFTRNHPKSLISSPDLALISPGLFHHPDLRPIPVGEQYPVIGDPQVAVGHFTEYAPEIRRHCEVTPIFQVLDRKGLQVPVDPASVHMVADYEITGGPSMVRS